jgi:iron complex transport system ATP-binding protein
MITLADVAFSYDERAIFESLTLEVRAGELVGVLGPNGAGKSTLARLALGLVAPSRGRVQVDGADLATLDRRAVARRVAAMLQEDTQSFPISARDCVLLGRLPHLPPHGFESSADLAAAEAAMSEVGVIGLATRALHTLSSGERRRVLLARTLAQGAPNLVLDEPAANLDLSHQLGLFALLRARAVAGAAVLVTVHDLNLAIRFCDRVALIGGGSRGHGAAAIGAPAEVLTTARVREVFGVEIEPGRTHDGIAYVVATRVSR